MGRLRIRSFVSKVSALLQPPRPLRLTGVAAGRWCYIAVWHHDVRNHLLRAPHQRRKRPGVGFAPALSATLGDYKRSSRGNVREKKTNNVRN